MIIGVAYPSRVHTHDPIFRVIGVGVDSISGDITIRVIGIARAADGADAVGGSGAGSRKAGRLQADALNLIATAGGIPYTGPIPPAIVCESPLRAAAVARLIAGQ